MNSESQDIKVNAPHFSEEKKSPALGIREEDEDFYKRELVSFVPDRVFDAHAHICSALSDGNLKHPDFPQNTGIADFLRHVDILHPGRHVEGLFLSWGKTAETIRITNDWISSEVALRPHSRGFFAVRPDDDPEWVRQETRRRGLHGFKCYHIHAHRESTWEADIPEYLPEALVKVAHEEGWGITLHMVKPRGVADPSNIHWIRHYCENYPGMKLILAHSARGFQPAHNFEGLPHLTGLENLYFDTSANCESAAHESIIRIIGHKKLMYGSDFPVSHYRGRSLAVADSFIWLHDDAPVWSPAYGKITPPLVGHEHLRSLKWACLAARLKDNEIEDIFWNNAAEIFGI